MYSAKRTNQNGSVAVFLIVAAVLAAAVVGGVYFVQERGTKEQVAQPTPQSQAPQADQQNDEAKKKAEADKQAQEAKQKADQEAAAKKKAEEQAVATKKQQEQAAKEQQQRQAASVPHTSTAPPPAPAPTKPLPTTGPSDTLLQLVAAGILLAVVSTYLRSYKHRFGSLLR